MGENWGKLFNFQFRGGRQIDAAEQLIKGAGGVHVPAVKGVGIGAQRDAGVIVAHAVSDGHNVNVIGQQNGGVGVPLGYNNDKTGNPYGTRVLSDSGC